MSVNTVLADAAGRQRPGHGRLDLTGAEVAAIRSLAADLAARHTGPDGVLRHHEAFLHDAAVQAHELPRRLRLFLAGVRTRESAAVSVIGGLPVDDDRIGPTPRAWQSHRTTSPTAIEETAFVLCGSLLGDLFGWATQQDGTIVHDLMPLPGHEHDQLGTGSADALLWHTEEAFHPLKCDYLGLMGLRNHDRIATTVATIDAVPIRAELRDVLRAARFVIRPDDSHLGRSQATDAGNADGPTARLVAQAQRRMEEMNAAPDPVPVLSGDPENPYLCIDPYYMDAAPGDAEARAALDLFAKDIDARLTEVTIMPGEMCFIDNYRAVHGRQKFQARYDGTDRWLKRINVTRDLRKSRAHRQSAESRVVY
ncbi:guanitoxin biosynthesis L-enduracididine beta-hydroxylase GntD [Jidongwangia harbinensis]|uniref:guanitoxin biosynthesis L-enduracididine beta-hydroxylase GntD n=1 Tax=Jidongwangia harbinensis TaxID=2878561 RepID=UPI001CD9E5D4|nr:guanitoxin biosynthesis L-enduracididine beta-hydroxylase GntD [Jidongwangia harbinensis]MCA2218368.1 TauD/TfdA family dioxygenase [Jidongwangia harbinensis]